jgi:stage V sporulation protein R
LSRTPQTKSPNRIDFYFDVFLQGIKKVKQHEYLKEIERYNQAQRQYDELVAEYIFFSQVSQKYPEFESLYKKHS